MAEIEAADFYGEKHRYAVKEMEDGRKQPLIGLNPSATAKLDSILAATTALVDATTQLVGAINNYVPEETP